MRPTTLSRYRIKKGTNVFKQQFDEIPTNIEFVSLIGIDEAVFKFSSKNKELYICFYENEVTTFADSLDYFFTEEEIKWMGNKH